MNQLKRFKILEACNYLLENLPSTQTDDVHKIWMKLKYTEDEELVLPDYKKCTSCGKSFPISYFYSKLGESNDCESCREYGLAIKGIKQSLRYADYINDMFDFVDDDTYESSEINRIEYDKREKYIQSIVDKLPKEFIELKILIVKSQKKLSYVTSKH